MPYKIVKADNGDAWVEVRGKKIAPQQVSAEILRKMKKTAEDYLGEEVTEAVITVPAYFNDSQRQATKDAGRIAGLEVKRIINEPTAAALAFGLDKKEGDRKIAVYDLGGGTFDISIIEIANVDGEHQFEVLSTNGDTFLGGEDFDQRIIDYIVTEFKKEQAVDLKNDVLALQRLKEAAEKAKIELSSSQQTEINLPYITADAVGPEAPVDEDHAREARIAGRGADRAHGRALPHRDQGCGRQAHRHRRRDPRRRHDAHAQGAGHRQGVLRQGAAQGREPRRSGRRRCGDPGVCAGGRAQGRAAARRHAAVAGHRDAGGRDDEADPEEHDDSRPRRTQVFSTADDNQPAVTIHVLQGERERSTGNKSLGQFNLEGIPPAPRGMPQIEVTFDIDANGILHVSAKDKATGKENKITIKANSGLSEDEIQRMVKDAEAHAEEDRKLMEVVQARNSLDALVHSVKKSLGEYGDKVGGDEKAKIEAALKEAEAVLKDKDAAKEALEAKSEALSSASQKLGEAMYAQAQSQAGGAGATGQGDGGAAGEAGKGGGEEKVVDAEYTEVKDRK